MFSLISLISCQPLLAAKTPPPPDTKPEEMGTSHAVDAPIAEVRMPAGQAIVRRAHHIQGNKAVIAPDAVVQMHHQIACRKRCNLC